MVGNHQEIQRALQSRRYAVRRHDGLALGKPVGIIGRGGRANQPGIGRHGGVQMRITEQDLIRKVVLDEGRILGVSIGLQGDQLLSAGRHRCSDTKNRCAEHGGPPGCQVMSHLSPPV